MEQHNIPEFMQEYYQGSDIEGRYNIERLARQYSDEQATFLQTTYVEKQEFLKDWNKRTGQRHQLTPDDALAPMRQEYSEKAKQLALEHGYKEQATETSNQEATDIKPNREAFLANLKSMREQQAVQQLRPRR